MLRKEMKELAQRALKGNYGKWSLFIILPMIIVCLCFIFMIILGDVSERSYNSSPTNIDSDSDTYQNMYDEGYQDGYKDGAIGPYDDSGENDFFDDYFDDYEYEYTPAYNYGYALGSQAGYLRGWKEGLLGLGDGYYRQSDQEIIDAIEEKPAEFLNSDEFEEGLLDAYDYNYSEAWEDAQSYQKDISRMSSPAQMISPVPLATAKSLMTPASHNDHYQNNQAIGFFLMFFSFGFFLFLLIISISYNIFYLPLLKWAGIDTIDGEKLEFRESLRILLDRWQVVGATNLKILIYTFLWSLLLVIPGIVKRVSYSMANYLLKREVDLDSNQALALSQELMKGNKIEYLIFQFSFSLWYLSLAYSLGFSAFYVIPYYTTAEAIFFDDLYYSKRIIRKNATETLTEI